MLLLYAQLNRKFFDYALHYVHFIHDVIPFKDLQDNSGSTTTPFCLATNQKPHVRYFRVFGCPVIFKTYGHSTNGKRSADKYSQQGVHGISVGFFLNPLADYFKYLIPTT